MASMPVRHVTMITNRMAARLKGSQPPSAIFRRFAPKKLASTSTNTLMIDTVTTGGQRQTSRIALYSRIVVSSMVVATAVP